MKKYIVDKQYLRYLIADFAKLQMKWEKTCPHELLIETEIYQMIDHNIKKSLKRKTYGKIEEYKNE